MVDQEQSVWWRRVLRRIGSVSLTLAVVGGAGFAVAFGSALLAERAEATADVEIADPIPVRVVELSLFEGYTVPREFVGQVEANASVPLSFELTGRLRELTVEEGAEVLEGTILARLDTDLLEAERTRLEASQAATTAQLDLAETRLSRAHALQADGHVSQEAVDQALATRDELASRRLEIAAAINAVNINLQKSELVAPFDGRVGLRNVDGGETLVAGAPVLTLIETAAPQVRVGLPLSIDAASLESVTIKIGESNYSADLTQVRPDIDPVTRTRTALFTLSTDAVVTIGQTATLMLETLMDAAGTWVPLDALQEGAGGNWTVLVVDDGVVRNAMVQVLHTDEQRAYVTGTFAPGTLMIAGGAHRVVPGQNVRVLAAAE